MNIPVSWRGPCDLMRVLGMRRPEARPQPMHEARTHHIPCRRRPLYPDQIIRCSWSPGRSLREVSWVNRLRPEATAAPILSEVKHTMSQADNPPPASVPDPAATSPSEVPPTNPGMPPDATAVSRPSGRTWMMVLAGGLLAGLAGFGFGEYALRLFAPSTDLPPGIQGDQTLAPLEHARRVRESQDRTATVSYGVLGALLGLALGAAGGLARRSPRAAITAALIGLVLGAAAGAGTTFLILPWYHASYATAES